MNVLHFQHDCDNCLYFCDQDAQDSIDHKDDLKDEHAAHNLDQLHNNEDDQDCSAQDHWPQSCAHGLPVAEKHSSMLE